MRHGWVRLIATALSLAPAALPAAAQVRPSTADSFALGRGGDTLCQVQWRAGDPAASGIFDRAYSVLCRDAAAPVARLYALRGGDAEVAARLDARRDPKIRCEAAVPITIADGGAATMRNCTTADGVGYQVLAQRRGATVYAAEGFGGYRSALELGVRTLAADRVIDAPLTIATTGIGDAASFARAQAGSLDADRAREEGYRRNNSGSYAESAEFFDTLLQDGGTARPKAGEYLVNRALQLSNLGDFDAADAVFAQALALPSSDPVELRIRRNDLAMHLLNRGRPAEARAVLERPIVIPADAVTGPEIDAATARALNDSVPLARQLGLSANVSLSPAERATALDAQASALRGTVLRGEGKLAEADAALDGAARQLAAIRGGAVASFARLQAQIMTERAAIAETRGNRARAEALLASAAATLAAQYPGSAAANAGRARLAAYLARSGRAEAALTLYREVVGELAASGGATGGIDRLLEPYFGLLVDRVATQPALVDDLFLASQTLVRPGVADTQAILARQLSAGSGEASRLFRQAINLTREAESLRVSIARLSAVAQPTAADRAGLDADRARLAAIQSEQAATQARLAAFPSFRALSTDALSLADLRAALRPGEAYWKLAEVGRSIVSIYVTPDRAAAWRVALTPDALAAHVDALRGTIAARENGQLVTYAFDVERARALYVALAGPMAATIPTASRLVFEPDGAMERLPVTLLVDAQPGVDAYRARLRAPGADEFDMRGISWLGARMPVSVATSARAFRDIRRTAASSAAAPYLGLGENAPVPAMAMLTQASVQGGQLDCRWPLATWGRPISSVELIAAKARVGGGEVETGAAFTDQAVMARGDLDEFRILHFATHGLVAAPNPACPARPALVTSFGGANSDGLLSFREIYGLKLDADLVILSACDTAAAAGTTASREAGVTRGGNDPLDGLVRAFVGAGARSVLATHWPAPDDYRATENLIGGLFSAAPGTAADEALRQSQLALMQRAETSHPFYWAGFVLIGDGARAVQPAR